ncbi:MAG: biotin--[acetyl-CoA-carboxylase] ligase [Candidatus Cryptobacteroides sp.]
MTNKHSILWLDNVDSTNTEARRRISDIDNLSVLSARFQTAGRGQRGNSWTSSPGENLTFSIVLKFGGQHSHQMQAYDQFAISQMAALSVLDFLASYDIEARIKWPNDIYIGDRKVCGMLIENSLNGEWMSWSIIGIGINVNQTDFPDSLVNPTSMALQTGRKFDVVNLLPEFMDIFEGYRHRYLHINGGLGKLRKLYLSQMWRKDTECTFVDYTSLESGHIDGPVNIVTESGNPQGRLFRGTVLGVSDTGNLIIRMKEGYSKEFGFKEIGWVL